MADFQDFDSFQRRFQTEDACAQALLQARWPNGFQCPKCGGARAYWLQTRKRFECATCKFQVSLTAGTIFENTRTPLTKWFIAIDMIARSQGTTATALRKTLQVTYKTAWTMLMKIRYAMSRDSDARLLTGVVRINAAIYGNKMMSVRAGIGEYFVMIGATLDEAGVPEQIKIKRISNEHIRDGRVFPSSVEDFKVQHVDARTSDIQSVYQWVSRHRCRRLMSLVKQTEQWVYKTFVAIGAKHWQKYIDEFCYRYNRGMANGVVFRDILHLSANRSGMTYREITRGHELDRGRPFAA